MTRTTIPAAASARTLIAVAFTVAHLAALGSEAAAGQRGTLFGARPARSSPAPSPTTRRPAIRPPTPPRGRASAPPPRTARPCAPSRSAPRSSSPASTITAIRSAADAARHRRMPGGHVPQPPGLAGAGQPAPAFLRRPQRLTNVASQNDGMRCDKDVFPLCNLKAIPRTDGLATSQRAIGSYLMVGLNEKPLIG